MRVLICHRPGGAFGFISDGWLNALNAAGFTAKRWDGNPDSWRAFTPHLYIGCSGHRQPIPKSGAKIAIHVNPYGPINTGVNEPAEAIRWTLNQNPTVVFGYGHQTDIKYWSYWTENHNIRWVPMPTGGDSTLFNQPVGNPRDIKIGYVGGRWRYKASELDKTILPMLQSGEVVVHGWGDWPKGQVSRITDEEKPKFFANCRVAPCVSEPHTLKLGIDLPERIFKVALSGALVVHDNVPGLERYLSSALVAKRDHQEFIGICRTFAHDSMMIKRDEIAATQRNEVLREHTYFQRLAGLFQGIWESTNDRLFRVAAETLRSK